MRNMLAFFAAMLLTIAGAGWYLGWYTVRSAPAREGQRSVTVDINTVKIARDLRAAEERIQQELAERSRKNKAREAAKAATEEGAPREVKAIPGTSITFPQLPPDAAPE